MVVGPPKDLAPEFTDHMNIISNGCQKAKFSHTQNIEKVNISNRSERVLSFCIRGRWLSRMVQLRPECTYPKETHTDQYLHFSSNRPLEHKRGVVKTQCTKWTQKWVMRERLKRVIRQVEEMSHVNKVLTVNHSTFSRKYNFSL